jgi:aspartyl-tRNA(Asn)/glutamyl-tRNA(Gln) amidotransferase subunit B
MDKYKITVGLEIHAELKTKSKMFCGCQNSPEEGEPNAYTCPICMGHPGTLPVINKEAVRSVLRVGVAAGSELANFTEFDRKNYFYPDIPKGYQISQYKYPLVFLGEIAGVKLTRIHLEEDTARSSHETPGVSLVDFNRAGVPLMELVTEPVIHSADEAMSFAKELQLLLQYLGVSDANMEKGEMRVEVNISVSKDENFGTKVEVKNINSFRAAGKAIDFEFKRQTALLEKGEAVVQETRGWDENKNSTFSQRLKESANDYRYFPDPDLPKLLISEIPELSLESLRKSLPELPWGKRERFAKDFGLKDLDIETYLNNREACSFFEEVVKGLPKDGGVVQSASNYITSDIIGLSKAIGLEFGLGQINVSNFVKLIEMIKKGDLSSRGAKDTLKVMFEVGGDPETIANEKGLIQKSNIEEIKIIAENVLNSNPGVVEEYKSGKESRLQFFIGQGMKESKGSANPEMLKQIFLELLK